MLSDESLLHTGVAAFCSGPDGRISGWNGASEELFGVEAGDVVGRQCHEVICGRDPFGNRFCSRRCACRWMAAHGEPIHPLQLWVRDRKRRRFAVRSTILVSSRRGQMSLLHLLEPVQGALAALEPSVDDSGLRNVSRLGAEFLTARELEVVRLLTVGSGTREIAAQLQISAATVRKHIENCLVKLGVHTRLEAVAVARQRGLV
jgi:DNA-binding CsgD family transcriptional regulator